MNKRIITASAALAAVACLSVSAPVFADTGTDELPAELMQNLDLDGNGSIDPREQARAERLRARVDWNQDGTIDEHERKRAQQAFEYTDRDGDGQLSAQERNRNRYRYNQLDANDDGRTGRFENRNAHELRDNADARGGSADQSR